MPTIWSYLLSSPSPLGFTPFVVEVAPGITFSWTLVPPLTEVTPTSEEPSTASPDLPCPISELTEQDFLDLFDRLFPLEYLQNLKDPGPGYELFQGFAKVGERVSMSVERLGCDAFILSSTGGSKATGTVQLFRGSTLQDGIPIDGQNGVTASIVSGASFGRMRVSGLTGITSDSIGHFLVLSNADGSHNNGAFEITNVIGATTVDVLSASPTVPDPNNGGIIWAEEIFVVTVKAGTVLLASINGATFVTTIDVTFQASDLGPFDVPIEARANGYAWNVFGTLVTAGSETLPGDIDTIALFVEEPPFGDTSIQVAQGAPTAGGTDGALDAHGSERGLPRNPGEDDDPYKARIRTLPDTISPDAFSRNLKIFLDKLGQSFDLIEAWDINYQTCYDAPAAPIPGSDFNPTKFVYDDPRPPTPFRGRWLDEAEFHSGIIAIVPNLPPINDVSMVYDDTAVTVTDLQSSLGARALSAYDVPDDVGFGFIQGCYDGFDSVRQATYKGIYDGLQRIKPAGVVAGLELEGQ